MDELTLTAPFAGTVSALGPADEQPVGAGTAVVVLEAMKMEHEIVSEVAGRVLRFEVEVGDAVDAGQVLAVMTPDGAAAASSELSDAAPEGGRRPDLEAVV